MLATELSQPEPSEILVADRSRLSDLVANHITVTQNGKRKLAAKGFTVCDKILSSSHV